MQPVWRPEGFRSITPYLVATDAANLINFYKKVFQAEERARYNVPNSNAIMHCELRIGDSVIELGDGNEKYPASPMELHLYVPDVNAVYERAVAAGAAIRQDLTTQDYGDREASIDDPSGNHWYVATHLGGTSYRPDGLNDLTPFLHVHGALEFASFAEKAFGALQTAMHRSDDGCVLHAIVRIGDSALEFSEAHGPYQPLAANLHLYVEDADAGYGRALASGATPAMEPYDAPYGDRASGVRDPFGNNWWIHTRRAALTA